MFVEVTLGEFENIIQLFESDNNGPTENYIDQGRLFIRGEVNDFMLRLNKLNGSLVIARIMFENQRLGNGSKLIEMLKKYGKEKGYKQIVIESLLSKEGYEFAKKHHFIKKPSVLGIDENMIYGDYYLEI